MNEWTKPIGARAQLAAWALCLALQSACSAVPFLDRDPAEPRDRASRFDRFVHELQFTLVDSAPLLEQLQRRVRPGSTQQLPWTEPRRLGARRAAVTLALARLDDDFTPERLDPERASIARTLRFDLRRELRLAGDEPPASGEGPERSMAVETPWSGILIEAPSVLAREHGRANLGQLESWKGTLNTLFLKPAVAAPERQDFDALKERYGARYPELVEALFEDLTRLEASSGTGAISDPFVGPFAEAARGLRGPDGAAFASEARRPLLRALREVVQGAFAELRRVRRDLPDGARVRTVAPLTGAAYGQWVQSLRDVAGAGAEPGALDELARANIERLTLELRAALGLPTDADVEAVRRAFGAMRRRERQAPGAEIPRSPRVLWDAVRPNLEKLVAGPLPDAHVEVDTARTFERPHGRFEPFVRGARGLEDPRARTFLYLRPRDLDPTVPRWALEAEALRYGLPGHGLLDAFRRACDRPAYLKKRPRPAFEGAWGLYATAEMAREGLVDFEDGGFGWRAQELAAFTAIVVDVGLHQRGWSFSQAFDTVLELTPLPDAAARELALRAALEPARAALPAIGLLRLRALRAYLEGFQGSAFRAADFHRALLENGPLPMPELDPTFQRWLASLGDDRSKRPPAMDLESQASHL